MESPDVHPILPQLRLDDLLTELQSRLQTVLATRDRVYALLEAVVTVGAHLDLEMVLKQIVEAASTLVRARYGALGVIGDGGRLAEFIPVGLSDEQIAAVHHWPEGLGLLGALISEPRPLRLPDIAASPQSHGFPPGHPPMRSFLGVPIRVRDEVYGNLYLTEKEGGAAFDEEDEALLVALAAAAGVAIDNARLYEEARRQQRWLRATSEVTRRLLSGARSDEVLALITRQALDISGADLVVLAVPTPDRQQLVIQHAAGANADGAIGLVLPAGRSLSGEVMTSGELVAVADFEHDPRVAGPAREHMPLGPALLLPLGEPGDVRGVFTVGRDPGGMPLPPEVVEMVSTFAAQAAIGLELAEHRSDVERLAILQDRDRIARDLHDLVIQRLYATGMSLQGAMPLLTRPEAASRVSNAVDALDDTIREIRSAIFSLQARGDSRSHGLRAQLLGVVDEQTAALGFAPSLRLVGPLDETVRAEVGEHLLGALREALSNAARHARASRVDVTVQADTELALRVSDNGTGMGASTRRSGLANLAERATELGGKLEISPAEGGGTQLDWRVPF
ncbi:MAG TPA: GAF domain-containing protein [Streptosporangiaceae bacterium]|nr:GAF domain-containing protein [Streptosporangiaceae bacterium]